VYGASGEEFHARFGQEILTAWAPNPMALLDGVNQAIAFQLGNMVSHGYRVDAYSIGQLVDGGSLLI
jgi:hypothetical protein